ncbi:MAG: diacylglycerol kinase family protein [Candidatus Komeilibacteria bacterium]|nr:diacylglycerol kinase family protein [Candidatus Komeilibacteria bacterium]
MIKTLIIFNPKAGLSYPASFQANFLRQYKSYNPKADLLWLETLENFPTQLKELDFNSIEKIIIIGGDGTIKKTVDFILLNKLEIPLAIIAQGSANVLANSLGLPLRLKPAIKIAALGAIKPIDVGCLNKEHYFLIGLSLGHLSQVVLQTDYRLKAKMGIFAYLKTLLRAKITAQHDFNFWLDGRAGQASGNSLVIVNALSVLKIKPKHFADFCDGQLEMLVLKNKNLWQLFCLGFFAWLNRRYLPYLFLKQGRKIIVTAASFKDLPIQIDGEELTVGKIEVEILPQRLKIITK